MPGAMDGMSARAKRASHIDRQSHLAPSSGGHALTAKRTVEPARSFVEVEFQGELDPGIREQPGSKADRADQACRGFALLLKTNANGNLGGPKRP
jgi:hypothetical protein